MYSALMFRWGFDVAFGLHTCTHAGTRTSPSLRRRTTSGSTHKRASSRFRCWFGGAHHSFTRTASSFWSSLRREACTPISVNSLSRSLFRPPRAASHGVTLRGEERLMFWRDSRGHVASVGRGLVSRGCTARSSANASPVVVYPAVFLRAQFPCIFLVFCFATGLYALIGHRPPSCCHQSPAAGVLRSTSLCLWVCTWGMKLLQLPSPKITTLSLTRGPCL